MCNDSERKPYFLCYILYLEIKLTENSDIFVIINVLRNDSTIIITVLGIGI